MQHILDESTKRWVGLCGAKIELMVHMTSVASVIRQTKRSQDYDLNGLPNNKCQRCIRMAIEILNEAL